jgi:hypothetical protein
MVIGERFAWAHLPKTGGSATLELFQLFPELILLADSEDSNEKHTRFEEREAQIAGKQLVMNIRRLPFWVLSRAQHVARWGVFPDYEPIPIPSADELADSDFPDSRLTIYTADGRFEIDRWLRMEHMAEDFLDFVSAHTDVTEERRAAVFAMPMVNTHEYDRELAAWFTPDQIERMYERNPLWEALERRLYGDLVRLVGAGVEASR